MTTATQTEGGLSWQAAARIAWRELQASRVRFFFVLLSVAIGVGALTGVRGFSDSLSHVLLGQARSILAADLSARMSRELNASEAAQLDQWTRSEHVEETRVTELVTMAAVTSDPVPLLVTLKVVDPRVYPFYGSVTLDPAGPLPSALNDGTVVVDESLLVRLRAHVGDTLRIGGHLFRIAALIRKEPDRLTAGVGVGPRVMMTRHAVETTGLLQPGSRWTERYLVRLYPEQDIGELRRSLQEVLPEAQVADFREGAPAITDGLKQATGLLSLICLVAMVLGAIGVGMAMRAHLQQRIDGIAIMKAMGARSGDVLRIYGLQALMLGAGGAALGVVLGLGVELALPAVIGTLLPLRPPLRLPLVPLLGAFGSGVLTTMLFALPPLLQVRTVRPNVVLRRLVESSGEERKGVRGFFRALAGNWLQILAAVVILAGLAGIATALSDSWRGGLWFAVSLAVSIATLLALSAFLLFVLRLLLARTRLALPTSLRQGLANLYRPGNQSAALLAALGVGVMLILSVFLMQRSIIANMHTAFARETPNVFLIDISTGELDGLRTLLHGQPGISGELDALPILSARIRSLGGTPVEQLPKWAFPRHMRHTVTVTWALAQPAGIRIEHGAWWKSDTPGQIAVLDRDAKRLHLQIGSQVGFEANGRAIDGQVAAIYSVDGQHISSRSEWIFAPSMLTGLPVTWYGAVHVAPAQIGAVQRAIFERYPTITAINIADILDTIQSLLGQITLIIRFLAGFSILSGAVILASGVASTRFRRIREVVVLKTLGATRPLIANVFSVEFALLGLLAGTAGALFANGLSRLLLHLLEVDFAGSLRADTVATLATAALAVVTGWLASYRILGQKPLEVLREE